VIEFQDVSYSYERALTPALSEISLTIAEGSFVAVVGQNGSGKSTFARLINALLLPATGKVTVCGIDTTDEPRLLELRRQTGIVFQNPDNQLVTTVVEEDVAFGPENLGVPPEEIRERVDEALAAVGLTDLAQHAAPKLSGGQKQRVAIAGMLAMRPRILVLDEASAMLDPQGRQEMLATVRALNREKGMTLVMITQYMEETVDCDRIIALHRGKVAFDGSPRAFFSDLPLVQSIGLDAPEAVIMREDLRYAGLGLNPDILTMEELAETLTRVRNEV